MKRSAPTRRELAMLSRAWFLIALGTAILLPLHAIWLTRTSEFYGGLNLLLGWTGHAIWTKTRRRN